MEPLILTPTFEAVDIIDTFTSLIWTDRYNAYGDFEICVPADSSILTSIDLDDYLWIKESEHTMIVENIDIDTDVEEGSTIKITGRSLESILERRVVWGHKALNGNFQNGIKTLLEEAIINPSITQRKISNFIFQESTDTVITSLTIDTQFAGDNLYDVIKTLCDEKKIGFKIVLNESNQFVFSLYSGVDRSYNQETNPYVVFSPNFENLINSNYHASKEKLKTIALVGGEGDGSERVYTSIEADPDSATIPSGLGRRELFVDAKGTSKKTSDATLTDAEYDEVLKAKGSEKLEEYVDERAFEGSVDVTRTNIYGKDFNMGDIVQIANEFGFESTSRVTEFIHSQSLEGLEFYPTFEAIKDE